MRLIFIIYFYLFFNLKNFSQIENNISNNEKSLITKKLRKIEARSGLEYYQIILFDYVYQLIDKDALNLSSISDFLNQKSNTLNFFQACGLFLFSLTNKKHDRHILLALERMYVLSSNAKLSELILWNIAFEYEKIDKFRVASELYNQFKKLFPGSQFYWTARYKEILTAYNFCQYEYHDIFDTERTITLAQEYIGDCIELNQTISFEIIDILQDLSLRMIKKSIDIALHYLKKNTYTYNTVCILSAWQRLDQLNNDILYFLECITQHESKEEKAILYQSTLLQMQKIILPFLEKHINTKLPIGENYEEENITIISYINNNKLNIIAQLKDILNNISYCIESYYEILQ
jgi:hypothetical protein